MEACQHEWEIWTHYKGYEGRGIKSFSGFDNDGNTVEVSHANFGELNLNEICVTINSNSDCFTDYFDDTIDIKLTCRNCNTSITCNDNIVIS